MFIQTLFEINHPRYSVVLGGKKWNEMGDNTNVIEQSSFICETEFNSYYLKKVLVCQKALEKDFYYEPF